MSELLLQVEGLVRNFGGLQALAGCSFAVRRGEICALVGPNGAGKSTAIACIAGALPCEAGRVLFVGRDITRLSPHERAMLGLVRTFQLSQEWPQLTVLENLLVVANHQKGESLAGALFARGRMHRSERENIERAEAILAEFGLAQKRDEYAGTLSGGQKRLLELARVAMAKARLALLDEPMAGVNPVLRTRVIQRIRDLRRQGVTFLIVEHDLAIVAELCERVIVMAAGKVLAEGTLEKLRRDSEVVEAYLGVQKDARVRS